MKRAHRIWIMSLCAIACLLGATHRSNTKPVHAQQDSNSYYDGYFYIYAGVDADNSNHLYVESYMEVDLDPYEDIDEIEVDGYADQNGDLIGDGYADGDDYTPADFELNGQVPTGYEYGMESDGYACYDGDDGEGDDDCDWSYVGYTYAYIQLVSPQPQITSLSTYSVNQGAQGNLTISGSNFIQSSTDQLTLNFSGPSNPFTLTSASSTCTSSCTATYSYNFTGYTAGSYTLTVTNNEGTSNSESFTVVSVTPPAPPPTSAPDSCDVMSNPQASYTSFVSTGISGGSGTVTISFAGSAFAALSPTVTYGPYSTPSSIAANLAALITRKYFRNGLSAKAFGPNIVYSGNATLGAVTNVVTGQSFSTNVSSTSATEAENSCESAPSQPMAPVEITVVAWIDGNAITLPQGESNALLLTFPPSGVGGPANVVGYAACLAQVGALTLNQLGAVSNTATDKAYANAWLLKFSGNQNPGPAITPSTFRAQPSSFRFFNDYSPALGIANTAVGNTIDPCGSGAGLPGEANSNNGHTGTSLWGYQYQLAEVRVDHAGQLGWATLNNQQPIPWVWSVIEFNQNGYPVRLQNASPINWTTNYQLFPTYSVYENGRLLFKTVQGTTAAFAGLPPGIELPPSIIQ